MTGLPEAFAELELLEKKREAVSRASEALRGFDLSMRLLCDEQLWIIVDSNERTLNVWRKVFVGLCGSGRGPAFYRTDERKETER